MRSLPDNLSVKAKRMSFFSIHKNKPFSEHDLLEEFARGDKSAAPKLYRQYSRYLTAICSRYVANDEDVRDIMQDAFLKIFSNLGKFVYRGEGSLKGWMARVVLNESLKFVRDNGRASFAEFDESVADPEDEPSVEDIPSVVIHQYIRELPDGYRMVFNLFVVEGKSHKEIAELLGIKVNTSASQFFKAKAILAKRINQYRKENVY